jgi:hypothetical protein
MVRRYQTLQRSSALSYAVRSETTRSSPCSTLRPPQQHERPQQCKLAPSLARIEQCTHVRMHRCTRISRMRSSSLQRHQMHAATHSAHLHSSDLQRSQAHMTTRSMHMHGSNLHQDMHAQHSTPVRVHHNPMHAQHSTPMHANARAVHAHHSTAVQSA